MTAIHADVELDCKGLLCPLPAYKTRQAIARLHPGQVLRVECTDPGSLADIPALARQNRWDLLSVAERDGVMVFVIQRPSLT